MAAGAHPSWSQDDALQRGLGDVLRIIFHGGAAGSFACALLLPWLQNGLAPQRERLIVVLCMVMAVAFVALHRWTRGVHVRTALAAACWSIVAFVCVIGMAMGLGIHAAENYFFCILICLTAVVSGARAASAMALFVAAWLVVLALAEQQGWLGGASAVSEESLAVRLLTLVLVLASAVSGGFLVRGLQDLYSETLRNGERGYRQLFAQLPVGAVLHRRGAVVGANAEAQALLPGLAGLSAAGGVPADDDVRRLLAAAGIPAAGVAQPVRLAARRVLRVSTGQIGTPAADEDEWLSMFVDDTEREQALRASERVRAHVHTVVAASPDGVLVTAGSLGGEILLANEALLAWLRAGDARDGAQGGVVGARFDGLGVVDDLASLAGLEARILATDEGSYAAMSFATPDGPRSMDISANAFMLDGVRHFVLHARDMTDLEQARREQQAILEHAALGIALTQDNVITWVNAACAEIVGVPPEAMVGAPPGSFLGGLVDGPDVAGSIRARLAQGERIDLEEQGVRADGTPFWVRLRGRAIDPGLAIRGDVWVIEDVTERRAMRQALADAHAAAEAASQAKSVFLANTSHEIRTPLNGIVGLAHLAVRPNLEPARRARHLERMLESADQLTVIMGAILDMAKIESGNLALESIAFDPAAPLRELLERHAAAAAERGIGMSVRLSDELPAAVIGDALRVGQVVGNYVANALKFTTAGSVVLSLSFEPAAPGQALPTQDKVLLTEDKVLLTYAVEDTGIGVASDVLPTLFQPFMQVDGSSTRRYGGAGLGLSICRALATLMGGEVGVRSAPGEGSRFHVTLPFALPPQDTGRA